ncbi:hypothetical protein ACF08M_07700 [Streptomyces sp. NPDC015032]|uniref:hypothetical protein n=1 Tax=Streptomyces sp. NPDC015032 TaxID=3364937 RepID=UPI003702C5A8
MTDVLRAADRLGGQGAVVAIEEIGAPQGLRCCTGHLRDLPDIPVSLIEEHPRTLFDAGFIDAVCADAARHLRAAAIAVGGAREESSWADWAPEFTFSGGREWMIRFACAPGAGEFGALVMFDDVRLTGVDDLAEVEVVGDEPAG